MKGPDDKKGDAFVLDAFQRAMLQNGEANAAIGAFAKYYDRIQALFCKKAGRNTTRKFMEQNDNPECRIAVKLFAEAFFLSGFRSGVKYKEYNELHGKDS